MPAFDPAVGYETDVRCFWCNALPSEAAARGEGPHSTWCPHFREEQRGNYGRGRRGQGAIYEAALFGVDAAYKRAIEEIQRKIVEAVGMPKLLDFYRAHVLCSELVREQERFVIRFWYERLSSVAYGGPEVARPTGEVGRREQTFRDED